MTTKRRRRPSMDNETAREEILRGAARLFMEQGYHATSVREIGDYLDISQSSLYYHAKNKPQILVDINKEFMADLVARFEAIDASDDPPLEKLRATLHELLRAIAENQEVVAVVLHERRSLPPAAARSVQRHRDRVDAIIDGIIEEGQAEGTFRDVQPATVRLALTGMANWAYTWFRPGGGQTADEIADAFADLLLRGIMA